MIGTTEPKEVAKFVRRLARFAKSHAWAIYVQTGTGRHTNQYARPLADTVANVTEEMLETDDLDLLIALADQCGRGIVNFKKAFLGERGAIEFRAFASTLHEGKVFHHIATCIGLMRKVAATTATLKFQRSRRRPGCHPAHVARAGVGGRHRDNRSWPWASSVPFKASLGRTGKLPWPTSNPSTSNSLPRTSNPDLIIIPAPSRAGANP